MSGLSQGTHLLNLKSVPLTVVEQLTFDAQKFWGQRDHGNAPFSIKFKWAYLNCPSEHACQIESAYN